MAEGSLAVTAAAALATTGVRRDRFFFWMSLLLALLMFAGFAPSVYLRGASSLVSQPPLASAIESV